MPLIEKAYRQILKAGRIIDGQKDNTNDDLRRQLAIQQVKEEDWQLRQRGVEVLADIFHIKDFPILTKLLSDPESDVRLAIVEVLGDKLTIKRLTHPKDKIENLVSLFKIGTFDDSGLVREYAARRLGKTHSPKALDALLITIKDRYMDVRAATAHALGRIPGQGSIEALIGLLDDQKLEVTGVAADSLKSLNWTTNEANLKIKYYLGGRYWDQDIQSLVSLGKTAVPALLEYLPQTQGWKRKKSIEA